MLKDALNLDLSSNFDGIFDLKDEIRDKGNKGAACHRANRDLQLCRRHAGGS
jgi:hypothetical protein